MIACERRWIEALHEFKTASHLSSYRKGVLGGSRCVTARARWLGTRNRLIFKGTGASRPCTVAIARTGRAVPDLH